MSAVSTILSSPAAVGVWELDSGRSSIRFENTTLWGALKVRGSFTDISGAGEITNAQEVSGRVVVKAASVDTGLSKRDDDLRMPSFFDVERYPDITVVVTGGELANGDNVRLQAELTVKGVTKALPLNVRVESLGDGGVRLTTRTTVTRKQFAVSGNMLGMVANRTKLNAALVFRRAAG